MSMASKSNFLNFILFPYRAFVLNPNESSKNLYSLRDERMTYVKKHCRGKVLDLGCGPENVFIKRFWDGQGIGVDVFQYPGLTEDQVLKSPPTLPFPDAEFDTVTLIANINHIPQNILDQELLEIARVLKPNGCIVLTRIGLITSFLTHNVVHVQSFFSKKYYDMDHERGMEEDERLTVSKAEIDQRMQNVGCRRVQSERFWTQWWLNEVLVYQK